MNKVSFLQTRNEGLGKDLYPGGPRRVLLGFKTTTCVPNYFKSQPSHVDDINRLIVPASVLL